MIKLYLLIIMSNTSPIDKVKCIYLLNYKTLEPEITAAIIAYETGFLSCNNCAMTSHNNLTGFMWKGKFIKYDSYSDNIKAYIKWQQKRYIPYKRKYPDKTYYDFLTDIYYCDNMKNYIINIKQIQKQLKL